MMIYLAGPVFTLAERRFNEELAGELERLCPSLQVFLPQRYDKEFQNSPDSSRRMFACLMGALDGCDVVVAVLDGPDADSGTSFEMGYARGRGKRVIGVRTDFRGSEDHGLNLMLSNACSDLVTEPSTTATPERLAERIVSVLAAGESLAPQRRFVAAMNDQPPKTDQQPGKTHGSVLRRNGRSSLGCGRAWL